MKTLAINYFSIVVLLLITQVSSAQRLPTGSQPFNQQIFEQIKNQHQGTKWLILLWSVDCPPCMKELALVETLRNRKKDLNVVLINVDTYESSGQQRQEILQHFSLTGLSHFYFRDGFEDHSRYLIDPQWFGELPRSYFVDQAGTFHGKSGLVAKTVMEKWLFSDNL